MKRSAPGINAGSMADMAFLLLVFFLLVTRIDDEMGIGVTLQEWEPAGEPTIVQERDLLTVGLLDNGMLVVEGDSVDYLGLKKAMSAFYLNSGIINKERGLSNFPERIPMELDQIRAGLDSALQTVGSAHEKEQLLMSNNTLKALGTFRLLPEDACILLAVDDSCDYDAYISLQNEIRVNLKALQSDFALKHFVLTLEEMEELEMNTALAAIQVIFPLKIVEQEKAEQEVLLGQRQ